MKTLNVEGQVWHIEDVLEDGKKVVVTLKGGQKIICGGAVAELVRSAFKQEKSKK